MAQTAENRTNTVPVKPANPLLYGNDILINDDDSEDQRGANLSIAYNGWAYAVYTVMKGTQGGFDIRKSTDNGLTWSEFSDVIQDNYQNVAVDLVVCGTSEADLILYQTGIAYFVSTGNYMVYVDKYNATTGVFMGNVFLASSPYLIYDIKIVSDYKFPSAGASPYSLGLLYSKYGPTADTLVFWSSADGGNTWGNKKIVATTGQYMNKISLSTGRCPNYNNGRYYAAWEQKAFNTRTGGTYVSHTDPFFDSDWLIPTRLDDIAGSSVDLTKNPVVVCQAGSNDNSLSNFTSIVLFDRDYYGNGLDYDVIGMYTKEGGNIAPTWNRLDVANHDMINEFESDANYDPGYDNFLVTYCDSTNQSLVYVVNGFNLLDPYVWGVINSAYNDNANLLNPFPKVEINQNFLQVGHVWIGERPGSKGAATWDAEYPVGISGDDGFVGSVSIYPNPCTTSATLEINLNKQENISAVLYNVYGQKVMDMARGNFNAGNHIITLRMSALPAGYYNYEIKSPTGKISGKVIVAR